MKGLGFTITLHQSLEEVSFKLCVVVLTINNHSVQACRVKASMSRLYAIPMFLRAGVRLTFCSTISQLVDPTCEPHASQYPVLSWVSFLRCTYLELIAQDTLLTGYLDLVAINQWLEEYFTLSLLTRRTETEADQRLILQPYSEGIFGCEPTDSQLPRVITGTCS